ncbi:hypothetical protein [Noviherbaspirillum soli]|uniref:hypothetical protein n=1 Tax=Noviherbaspirillum soli TaxID=1064518 RepID=UPI00188D9E4F|nr:hypothetical protein [Noviherbaspirillum soli]
MSEVDVFAGVAYQSAGHRWLPPPDHQAPQLGYATGSQDGSYDKSAVTPVAGLVARPMQNLSLCANRVEALTRGAVAGSTLRARVTWCWARRAS